MLHLAGCSFCSVLVIITGLGVMSRKRFPYFIVGWLWFLGAMVPVIGLVQVGSHAMADRYTYIPLNWLYLLCSRGIAWNHVNISIGISFFCSAAMVIILMILASVSWVQGQILAKRDHTFRHAVALRKTVLLVIHIWAQPLSEKGSQRSCLSLTGKHWESSLIMRKHTLTMGTVLANGGKYGDAIDGIKRALQYNPIICEAYNNQGIPMLKQVKSLKQ